MARGEGRRESRERRGEREYLTEVQATMRSRRRIATMTRGGTT